MEIFFYIFSFLLVFSASGVVMLKKPVYSVLSLIFCFINLAALFILLGAEFLSMLIIIVYVGAVAVLFLFVVMMIGEDEKKTNYSRRIFTLGWIVSSLFLFEILLVIYLGFKRYNIPNPQIPIPKDLSNTKAIGSFLYSEFIIPFEVSSIILLLAMIGSIVLTLRVRSGIKKQNISDQTNRNPNNSLEIVKLEPGKSIYDNK